MQEVGLTYQQAKSIAVKIFQVNYVSSLLKKHRGNVTQAAKEANLNRSNFLRLLRSNGINPQSYRS